MVIVGILDEVKDQLSHRGSRRDGRAQPDVADNLLTRFRGQLPEDKKMEQIVSPEWGGP
jgi:hypothetical protein